MLREGYDDRYCVIQEGRVVESSGFDEFRQGSGTFVMTTAADSTSQIWIKFEYEYALAAWSLDQPRTDIITQLN